MKVRLILFLLLGTASALTAQPKVVFGDTVDFSHGLPHYFSIDTTQPGNVWQAGQPSKIPFDSAWSSPNALMTDTANPFPAGNTSSFTIRLHVDSLIQWMCIGNGSLFFRHRYDFDSLLAGGFIEVRYYQEWLQEWTSWFNLANDTLPIQGITSLDPGEYPVATITGGIPAYTGTSQGWQLADFQWFWMMLVKGASKDIWMENLEFRFTALSDSLASPTPGWMIDDIEIVLYECYGSVDETNGRHFTSRAAPNPGTSNIRILTSGELHEQVVLEVRNRDGLLMEQLAYQPGESILISSRKYPAGYYLYKMVTASGSITTGKFIKL